jgi:anti-sigma B factor antagonist
VTGAPEPFVATLEPHREAIVVVARGEIDLDSISALEERLREVLDAGFSRIVLDLRNVSFVDSTGLRAILTMDATSRAAGVRFALVQGPYAVRHLFELTSTDQTLRFIEPHEIDARWV